MKPEEMRFSKEHEWVASDDAAKEAVIGITDYAAEELGDIVYIELPQVGTEVAFMEPIGTIEAVKTVADLYCPISGLVKAVNTELEDNPELINKSPFDRGWFAKIAIKDPGELDKLMSYDEYRELIGKG